MLLYGSEIWVVSPSIGKTLGRFHHRMVQRLTGKMTQKNLVGIWKYPFLAKAMLEADVQEVETYISCRQNTVAKFITTRLIMELFLTAARRPGAWILKQRW